MTRVHPLEAKTTLSKLVDSLERGQEQEIIIARKGGPVARLTRIDRDVAKRIGIAKGLIVPENIDTDNAEIARLFGGDCDSPFIKNRSTR